MDKRELSLNYGIINGDFNLKMQILNLRSADAQTPISPRRDASG